MKRIVSFISVISLLVLLGSTTLSAQTTKGKVVVSGGTSLSVTNNSIKDMDSSETIFTLTPSFGYFVIDNLSVGLNASLITSSGNTTYAFLPTASYYFNSGSKFIPNVSLGIGYSGTKISDISFGGLSLGTHVGATYMLTSNVGFDMGVGYLYSSYSHEGVSFSQNTFAGALGFSIFF